MSRQTAAFAGSVAKCANAGIASDSQRQELKMQLIRTAHGRSNFVRAAASQSRDAERTR